MTLEVDFEMGTVVAAIARAENEGALRVSPEGLIYESMNPEVSFTIHDAARTIFTDDAEGEKRRWLMEHPELLKPEYR